MCESNVYLNKDGNEELIMENVAVVTPVEENKFILKGLLGERKEIAGTIEDINLMGHRIVIKAM